MLNLGPFALTRDKRTSKSRKFVRNNDDDNKIGSRTGLLFRVVRLLRQQTYWRGHLPDKAANCSLELGHYSIVIRWTVHEVIVLDLIVAVDNQSVHFWGSPRCKNLWYFFFVSLAGTWVWLLFNDLLVPHFSLFYVSFISVMNLTGS